MARRFSINLFYNEPLGLTRKSGSELAETSWEKAARLIFDELRAIQNQYGYLPAEQMEALSKRTGTPLYRIHGVADFYPHFHLKPPPKVRARVCTDMACHVRGADALQAGLRQ